MKKYICMLTVLMILLFIQTVNAQLKVGVLGGLNYADIKADTEFNSRNLPGIGFILEKTLNDKFSLIAELMYLQKGGILPAKDGNPNMKIKGSFIEIPIFLKYSIMSSKNFKTYLLTGPSVGIKLSMDMDAEIAGVALNADLNPVTKTFDFGLGIGGGIEFPFKTFLIFLEGRYAIGLTNLHKNGTFKFTGEGLTIEEKLDDNNKFKTRGIQIMLGAKISLGK